MTLPSIEDVRAAVRILFKRDEVVELRAIGSSGVTTKKTFILSGYYSDFELLARDAVRMSERPDVTGVFWTIQTIKTELLARSANRYRAAKQGETTADLDVVSYRWLPIDVDPVRSSGISSSDGEKQAAREVVQTVGTFFRELGVNPIVADSGNGFHILIPIALGSDRADLVKAVLAALAARFGTAYAKIDRTIFNAARILKVYGTVARKGEATESRPHRRARLVIVPDAISEPLAVNILEKIAAGAPEEPTKKKKGTKVDGADLEKGTVKVEEFLKAGSVEYLRREEYAGGYKWILTSCPFNSAHVATSVIVTIADSCAMGFKCSHNGCYDKHWEQFREHLEAKMGRKFQFADKPPGPEFDPNAIVIVTNPGCVVDMIHKSEEVLNGYGLKYFERSGLLVNTCYGRDVETPKEIERAKDSIIIQTASEQTILRDLDNRASYVYEIQTARGTIRKRVRVPRDLPRQIHDRVRSQPREVPYSSLDMVSGAPVLLPSGNVHEILLPAEENIPRGSIFQEGVMLSTSRVPGYFKGILDRPTREHALQALKQFEEIFCGFPFVDSSGEGDTKRYVEPLKTASYSAALCGPLSLVARPFLGISAIPIIGATAPMRRTGKTKIVEAGCMAALGHKPTAAHYTDEVELGKHLQPLMMAGDRAVLIDNVERALQSSKLCILVTGNVLRDRVLGESRDVILKNYSVIFATGNNLVFGGDLSARAIRADINPAMERPESRAFNFDPVARASERHPQLVVAALTMLRAYLLAGAPWLPKRATWGGFEAWDKLVCGCLVWLGMADPYLTRDRIINSDPLRMASADILQDWFNQYQGRTVSFADIRRDRGDVYEALLKSGAWDGFHAGWILRRLEGQVIGGYMMERMAGRSRFRVVKADDQGDFGSSWDKESSAEEAAAKVEGEQTPF